MKVILLDNIRGIGHVGDIKEVNDGYARNFLFPRKLGKSASDHATKELESLKAKKLQATELARAQSETLAKRLSDTTVVLQGKSNEQGKLFSGITSEDIAEAISREVGVRIPPDSIELNEHIKTIGDHTARIKLSKGISTEVKITVQNLGR